LNARRFSAQPLVIALLSIAFVVLTTAFISGCSGDSVQTTSSSQSAATSVSSGASTSTSSTAPGATTTTLPRLLSDIDKEIAKTSTAEHDLQTFLSDQQVPQGDPRHAVSFGLRARIQALSCRKALDDGDVALADTAMKNVYTLLNVASNVATGTTAKTLGDAHSTIAALGDPSDRPDEARTLLDQFVAQLAPLLDEAAAIEGQTTST
jgi:hypothetical protein